MAFIIAFACRRRHSLHQVRRIFSTSATETPSDLSIVSHALFCHESDPIGSVSILFSFPDQSCARYAADHSLRRISVSLNPSRRSDLLNSFLPLASSEQDFASLLLSYGSAYLPRQALAAFRHHIAAGGSLSVSTLSFNALLSAFLRSRSHREVPELFISVCEEHSISPDVVSYGLLIQALFYSSRSTDAFAVIKRIRDEQGIVLTDQIYKLLLISLHSHGKSKEVNQLWDEMVADGVKLDCTAYNVKVWYHTIRGETNRVLELISEMESAEAEGVNPDTVTYNYLIACYSKNNQVEDVKEVYKLMSKKGGCSPNSTTFIKVLRCLCRNGDFEMAMEVFRDSLRSNVVLCFRELKELVSGLVKEGKVEAVKEVIKEARIRDTVRLTSQLEELEKEDRKISLDRSHQKPSLP